MINMFTETQDRLTSHKHTTLFRFLPGLTIWTHQLPVCLWGTNILGKKKKENHDVHVYVSYELMTACVQMVGAVLFLEWV